MTIEKREEIYQRAFEEFGSENQIIVCIEELSELAKELTKELRGNGDEGRIAEEIADVKITVEQMILYHEIREEVEAHMEAKLKRLEERL